MTILKTVIETLRLEGMVSLTKAARAFHVSPATMSRWCHKGGTDAQGLRVFLEHARTPGQVKTSIKAVERFMTALSGTPVVAGIPSRSPAKLQQASEEAARELKEMGI